MTLTQGWDSTGEIYSSAYAVIERDPALNPAIYLDCSVEPSLTRQEFAEECDINNIMARYETTGSLGHLNKSEPAYLDLTDLPDLQGSLSILADATAAFMRLPATVRREFENDAVKFCDYAQNPENLERMREWGLAPPAPTKPEPQEVRVVNEPPAAPAP